MANVIESEGEDVAAGWRQRGKKRDQDAAGIRQAGLGGYF
jgi:hypothetical protein